MLSVEQAWTAIAGRVAPAAAVRMKLAEVLGRVLAEDVVSPIDSPPFDKALMDGYAVRSTDVIEASSELSVIGELAAGVTTSRLLGAGEAYRIMTGAPIPPGADAVVPFEKTQQADERVSIRETFRVGANLARQGESLRRGDRVLNRGMTLGPSQIGVLAEMGMIEPLVIPAPEVAILATGDELVPYDQVPGPGQIRNTNEIMVLAQIHNAGAIPRGLGVARDEREHLLSSIREGLKSDILCLTGGVSKGTRDFVPDVLKELGVEAVFHGCDIKPGKPIWFGSLPAGRADEGRSRWIFGLPGNPVSTMVCFELFVRTAIRRLQGMEPAAPALIPARLTAEHVTRDSRRTFAPAMLDVANGKFEVRPLKWQGSFDLHSAAQANSLVVTPAARTYSAGETLDVLPLRS